MTCPGKKDHTKAIRPMEWLVSVAFSAVILVPIFLDLQSVTGIEKAVDSGTDSLDSSFPLWKRDRLGAFIEAINACAA